MSARLSAAKPADAAQPSGLPYGEEYAALFAKAAAAWREENRGRAGRPRHLMTEAELDQQLQYLEGFPEAQRAAREAFAEQQRAQRIAEAAGQEPITVMAFAHELARLGELAQPEIGPRLSAMLDQVLIAVDALTATVAMANELGEIAAGIPPVDVGVDLQQLSDDSERLADQLLELADNYAHAFVEEGQP